MRLLSWLTRLLPSRETRRRVRRTLLQAVAGGALTSIGTAILGGNRGEIIAAASTVMATVIASLAQNTLEDAGKVPDGRTP